MTDIEQRAGIEALEKFHHRRRQLVAKLADLRAFKETWKDDRKVILAAREIGIRVELESGVELKGISRGPRGVTDKAVDALAHDDNVYTEWLLNTRLKLAEEMKLSEELKMMDQQYFRDQAILRGYAEEASL